MIINPNISLYNQNLNKNLYNNSFILKNFLLKVFKKSWIDNFVNNSKFKNILLFEVLINSNKKDIKLSVELIFGIKVLSVNTNIKKYRFRKLNNFRILKKKKAYIKFLT